MIDGPRDQRKFLIVESEGQICCLQLKSVVEIMRPLPVEPINGMPPFIRGVSIIRGVPTPVVDLAILLGRPGGVATRLITLRVDDRQVGLSVGTVVGIRDLDLATTRTLPPLLRSASKDSIEAICTLDSQLLIVLQAGWELPDEVWQAVADHREAQ